MEKCYLQTWIQADVLALGFIWNRDEFWVIIRAEEDWELVLILLRSRRGAGHQGKHLCFAHPSTGRTPLPAFRLVFFYLPATTYPILHYKRPVPQAGDAVIWLFLFVCDAEQQSVPSVFSDRKMDSTSEGRLGKNILKSWGKQRLTLIWRLGWEFIKLICGNMQCITYNICCIPAWFCCCCIFRLETLFSG